MIRARSKPARTKTTIARHPAFALILSLWVAALLGLAIMVLPVGLIEGLVAQLHIAEFVPAAAPPLGNTARMLLALGFAGVGAITGFLAARTLARLTSRPAKQEVSQDEPDADEADHLPFDFDGDEDAFGDEPEPQEHALVDTPTPSIINVSDLGVDAFDSPIDDGDDEFAQEAGSGPDFESEGTEDEQADLLDSYAPTAPAQGIDLLRERSVEELSLAELVERFAGALADRREMIAKNPDLRGQAEPVIAEALRALTRHHRPAPMQVSQGNAAVALSTREQADETEAALRDALQKLQSMSGG